MSAPGVAAGSANKSREFFVILKSIIYDPEGEDYDPEQLESNVGYPTLLEANQAARQLLVDYYLPVKANAFIQEVREEFEPDLVDGIEEEINRDSATHFYKGRITLAEEGHHRIKIRVIALRQGKEEDDEDADDSEDGIHDRIYSTWDEGNPGDGKVDERERRWKRVKEEAGDGEERDTKRRKRNEDSDEGDDEDEEEVGVVEEAEETKPDVPAEEQVQDAPAGAAEADSQEPIPKEVFLVLKSVSADPFSGVEKEQLLYRKYYPTILSANRAAQRTIERTWLPFKQDFRRKVREESGEDSWRLGREGDGIEGEKNRDSETNFYAGYITIGQADNYTTRVRTVPLSIGPKEELKQESEEDAPADAEAAAKAEQRRRNKVVYEEWDEKNRVWEDPRDEPLDNPDGGWAPPLQRVCC